ncbi:MAG: DNA translocase FtsK 4TM domain-containing protein [Tepidanaerobacteraceae bacterium]|jgi:S-DNA-T family DNA segregation ATPase FtsK/SpoIIIE|nr:DNA translocase FtsK 4TM domain-containing protein [Tepidanaerobacteraceae bacterium]HQE05452.1 DNA translocase FtsK 4TM domain-containing protein [Tepidanaerobacteraceae bacterium]
MAKTTRNIKNDIRWEIKGLLFISFGVLGIFSIYTNAVGVIGKFISKNLKGFSGQAAVLIPLIIILLGVNCLFYKKKLKISLRVIGLVIIFAVIVFLFHINTHANLREMNFLDRLRKSAELGVNGQGGGILGESGLSLLISIFGTTGSTIMMITFFIIGSILATGKSITTILERIKLSTKRKKITINPQIGSKKIKVVNNIPQDSSSIDEVDDNSETATRNTSSTQKEEVQKIKSVKNEEDSRDSIIITDYIEDDKEYNLPPLSLLRKNSGKQRGFCEKELLDNAQTLENTLKSFGLEAKVIQVNCGPTITRFEIQPSPGIKVSRIMSLADDIALSLAASDVRIEAPIPGKAAVGIEVPNKKKSLVLMRDVLESTDFVKSPSKLSIALGMDIDGNPKVADLTEMPHLLIAGATGSGKSVCIKTIISSILFKAHPNEVKLMMIDPKVVELAIFDGIPHLLTPVVTDAKKAAAALSWMVGEMERRYQLFAEEGVRDIARYNELYNDKPMPKIVVIIDELADLMMVAPRDVEDCICRLAQMARAAGIHLVVATQRPSVDVITGLIKANIPSRISFAVSSQVDSRTILDISGAEKLLGKGDMLFYPVGAPKPVRIQGAYITEEEVEKLINYCKKQKEPAYEKNLSDFNEVGVDKSHEETDELFEEAVKVVLDSGQASISMLQRRLRIGYARAARLIDEMEQRGIVGGYEGTKPREILISKEHYEKYFQN